MKLKTRELIEHIIEVGIERGYRRATKHTEIPSQEYIKSCIEDCVMAEFYEWFDFSSDSPTSGFDAIVD